MRFILNEDDAYSYSPYSYFKDADTGKVYVWTGKEFKELKPSKNKKGKKKKSKNAENPFDPDDTQKDDQEKKKSSSSSDDDTKDDDSQDDDIKDDENNPSDSKDKESPEDKKQDNKKGNSSKDSDDKKENEDKPEDKDDKGKSDDSKKDPDKKDDFKEDPGEPGEPGEDGEEEEPEEPKAPEIGKKPESKKSKEILDKEQAARDAENGEPESEEARNARLEKIKDLLNNKEVGQAVKNETERKVFKSRQDQAEKIRKRELQKYRGSLEGFIVSINNFIKNEIKETEYSTYSRMNKVYNSNLGLGVVKPGRKTYEKTGIPVINVYYDQSASWNETDVEVGNKAIGSLNKYVKQKKLKINIYYFAVHVADTNDRSVIGGGTRMRPVIDHILETRPDNVIIMTDSDTTSEQGLPPCKVKGGVWLLWKKGERSEALANCIRGRKLTKEFNIDY